MSKSGPERSSPELIVDIKVDKGPQSKWKSKLITSQAPRLPQGGPKPYPSLPNVAPGHIFPVHIFQFSTGSSQGTHRGTPRAHLPSSAEGPFQQILPPDLTAREPLVNEVQFERFVKTSTQLMSPGRDIMWVLCGRAESNVGKIKKILTAHNLKWRTFFFVYNAKQMQQYGYWKRLRGIANSKTWETVFMVFAGKMPKNFPKGRWYVDQGSMLYNEVLKNVPVLHPRNHAYVSKQVRETSLATMAGVPLIEDENEMAKAKDFDDGDDAPEISKPADERAFVMSAVRKRKLYRQMSDKEEIWFPHDNDPELLKELCFEAGKPRWVLMGTPASGAGMHGCFEMGASVVALCYDDHHRENLQRHLLQRAVEAMATGASSVFKDEDLRDMSVQLNLNQEKSKKEPEGEPSTDNKSKKRKTDGEPNTDNKSKKRKTEPKTDKSKKRKKSESSSESSSES